MVELVDFNKLKDLNVPILNFQARVDQRLYDGKGIHTFFSFTLV